MQNNRVTRAQWTCRTDAGPELSVAASYVDQPQMQTIVVQWSRCTTITFRATEARPGEAQDLPNPPGPQEAFDFTAVSELLVSGFP